MVRAARPGLLGIRRIFRPGWAKPGRHAYDVGNWPGGTVTGFTGWGVLVAEGINDADLRRLLAVIDACRSAEAAKGLPAVVLERARALVPCVEISFLELDSARQRCYLGQGLVEGDPGEKQGLPVEDPGRNFQMFWYHYWDFAPACYPDRSHDLTSITTISDFYSRRQLHNTGMYADNFGPQGIEATAMMRLSAPAGRSRRLIFFRGPRPTTTRPPGRG
jgi:hypothetical protein